MTKKKPYINDKIQTYEMRYAHGADLAQIIRLSKIAWSACYSK